MRKPHALIIGGTKGLGKTLAKQFANAGYQVSVFGRTALPPADHQHEDIAYIKADLFNEADFLNTLTKTIQTNKIDHLIFLQRFKGDGERWQNELEVSLNMPRKIIEVVKNNFTKQENALSGSIVFVSSVAGRLANDSQPISYSIAKAGLNHFVKYYAAELGPLGIRVNAVSPITFIKEESKKFYLEEKKEINEFYKKIIPLKRMCTAEDVAHAIYFLCSENAAFISGQNIDIDGGLSALSHETLAKAVNTN